MDKVKEASFGELINFMNKVGWDNGFKLLENHLNKTEWLQADLFSEGDAESIKKANRLSPTIIRMQISIGNLRKYAVENNKLNPPPTNG